MSLCLIDVHGDIEGDFEWAEELPRITNGDVIKALFSGVEVKPHKEFSYSMDFPVENKHYLDVTIKHENIRSSYLVPKKWWNAPYKENKK